jgi:hypothetical protein
LSKGCYFCNDLQVSQDRQLLQAAGQLSACVLWTDSIIGNCFWPPTEIWRNEASW